MESLVQHTDLLEWVAQTTGKIQHEPGEAPKLLILLPSNIVINNFIRRARLHGTATEKLKVMTLQDLAELVLKDNQGTAGEVLDQRILVDISRDVIKEDKTGRLDLFKPLPIDERATITALLDEYEEYIRASYVTELHQELLSAAEFLKSPYEKEVVEYCLDTFQALEDMITKKLHRLQPNVYQTRHHLLKNAATSLSKQWPNSLESIKGIAIAAITVFDSLSSHLLQALIAQGSKRGISSTVISGTGTHYDITKRFSRILNIPQETSDEVKKAWNVMVPQSISCRCIAAPDRRREALQIAREIRQKIQSGTSPHDILLIARDCGRYLPYIKDIFPSLGIPYYVQTRRLYAHLHQYGFLRSLFNLLALAGSGAVISWDTLTSPIRLGFCTPNSKMGWPVEAREVFHIEQRLAWLQNSEDVEGFTIAQWKAKAPSKLGWAAVHDRFTNFIDEVENILSIPLTDVQAIIKKLKNYWDAFLRQQSNWESMWADPRVIEQARFSLTKRHPTSFEHQLRRELIELETYLKDFQAISNITLTWRQIATAFARLVLSETFGLRELDQAAVPFVDAGNAFFRTAKHVYVLGMLTEEFPRKCPSGIIIPDEFRKCIDNSRPEILPFLYLRNPENDFQGEVDFFEAAVSTATESILFTMPYLDQRGHTQAWSPFIERLGIQTTTLPPDHWLPQIPGNYQSFIQDLDDWTRWSLFLYHQNQPTELGQPSQKQQILEELGKGIDDKKYSDCIQPRTARFLNPPSRILVNSKEPWMSGLLQQLAGPPYHAHELDLYAICPMQFYFYQFLYNLYGTEFARDKIPPTNVKLRWRYGPIPHQLEFIYSDDWTEQALQKTVEAWSPRRKLSTLTNEANVRSQLARNAGSFYVKRFWEPFAAEWELACNEEAKGLNRDWKWNPGGTKVTLRNLAMSADVVLPPHRIDQLSGCTLPVTYINYSQQADSLLHPLRSKGGKYKPVTDLTEHRLPILLSYYENNGTQKVGGGLYIELYSGYRTGYFHNSWKSKHGEYTNRRLLNMGEWRRRIGEFTQIILQRVKEMTPAQKVEYPANRSIMTCGQCVYRTLCFWRGNY